MRRSYDVEAEAFTCKQKIFTSRPFIKAVDCRKGQGRKRIIVEIRNIDHMVFRLKWQDYGIMRKLESLVNREAGLQ